MAYLFLLSGLSPYGMGFPRRSNKSRFGILVVRVDKRMYAVGNACRDGERVEGEFFYAASCVEVEEPVGTLEVYCWSEAYIGFCAGFRGVSWEGFFVCLGVCAEFDFAVFFQINGGPCHERLRRDRAGHDAVYWERIDTKNCVFYHAGYHSVWGFL